MMTDKRQGQNVFGKQATSTATAMPRRFLGYAIVLLLLTDLVTGMIQGYSDYERELQAQLSQLTGSTYQLRLADDVVSTEQGSDALARAQQQGAQRQLEQCLRLARSLHYQDTALSHIGLLLHNYLAARARVHAHFPVTGTSSSPIVLRLASDQLIGTVEEATTDASQAAFKTSLFSHYGSIAMLLAAFTYIVRMFRRVGEAQSAGLRIAAEKETLRRSEQRFQALVYNSSDVIAIVDPEGRFLYLSSATKRLWNYAPEELEGTLLIDLVSLEETLPAERALRQAAAQDTGSLTAELRLQRPDGSCRASEIIFTNLIHEPGIGGIVLTCRDITERKAFEGQLAHQAFHDALTGLANRALFMERLQHALERTHRSPQAVGLIFMDLDNFKIVNDSLGHEAGDTLLKTVAERLQSCVRPGDTVARLGGDEFTLLLEDLDGEEQVYAVAERIGQVLLAPINVQGREVVTTGSLGIAISHGDYTSPDALLRDSDTAMYQAKTGSKARSVVFDVSMNTRAVERLELEIDLRRALETDEFCVYYQPILNLETGDVVELEALVRWQHPTRGLISPITFIPLAEETGLIVPLGKRVLFEACRQAKQWQAEFPQERHLCVAVNLSARQLQEPDIVQTVAQALHEAQLDPGSLNLEITESVMMKDREQVIPKLHELKALGVCLALDDFGTGYSSMSYLSTLPLDVIKIDRSFVLRLGQNNEDEAIVSAIVQLAKTLNLQITSEGIETHQQLTDLRALGCDTGQGYLFARPLPEPDMREYLKDAADDLPQAA